MKMSFPIKLLKNRDESDETQSDYYEHEAIGFRGQKYIRTVPNDLRFRLFMHFKKVSRKETVFNQSNGRKFKNSLYAQGNSLTEQRDYF